MFGAKGWDRTSDAQLFRLPLYRLSYRRKKMKCALRCAALLLGWCPGRDSNPHALPRHPLKMVCLPIPPPGHLTLVARAGFEPRISGL